MHDTPSVHGPLEDLSACRILISNDDGITAPGIAVLERIARTLSDDVWVVAPETEQSGAGHSLSLHDPIRYRQIDERHFAVGGTPTDSVLLGVHKLVSGKKPDLILSGVNRGANLGDDITYSGTVAAAMEGTLLGMRAIALSQIFRYPNPVPWETVEAHASGLIKKVCAMGWPTSSLININFPNCAPDEVTGVEVTRQGRRKIGDGLSEHKDPRGRPYVWIGPQRTGEEHEPGTDLAAIKGRHIAITPLSIDLTDFNTLTSFTKAFAG